MNQSSTRPRSTAVIISGKVQDADSGLPMWLAHVVTTTDDGEILEGDVTHNDGTFLIPVEPGQAVRVSFVGYATQTFVPETSPIVVMMQSIMVGLPEVEIFPEGPAVVPPVLPPVAETLPPGSKRNWLIAGVVAVAVGLAAKEYS